MGIISSNILELLQEQYRHEMRNHFRYLARSSWARYRGFEGAGDFFEQEAEGEKGHADKVRKYIEDRNEAVIIVPFDYSDSSNFADFADLFTTALEVERDTTERLSVIYAEAIKAMDYMTSSWVQSLIIENIEEENLYTTIIDRITARGVDTAANHDIDVWLAERSKA